MEVVDIQVVKPMRVCAYLRVSTTRQNESDLSIPDQHKQIVAYAAAHGWSLIGEYVDPGVSGREDDRPEFQKMIERALDNDQPFDLIAVHSFSRFFRDAFGLEMYVRKLAKANVRVVSITQELGDDPAHAMIRQIIALFDEYQSRETGKHVLRSMKENFSQGYYNGSPVPLGYTTVDAEKRGARVKRKIAIDAVEAELVRLIFKLYLHGDGKSGPLGVKAVANWLNERGYRLRKGGRFGSGTLQKILVNPIYKGEWSFNRRDSRTQRAKPAAEHVTMETPAIISADEFEAVGATLRSRNPRVTPPRVVTGPILLTGLATCATCGGGMTLRTGTSKSGRVFRYYSCSRSLRQGKTGCRGRSIPMDKLDTLVTEHLCERLFRPERLTALLAQLTVRQAAASEEVGKRIADLQAKVSEADEKLRRLYKMVEDGIAEPDEILRDRIADLRQARDQAQASLDRAKASLQPSVGVDPEAIARFGAVMRENVTTGSTPFRKAYIQSVVDRVEVDDEVIRIYGSKATLEQVIAGKAARGVGVRNFARKWRAQRESNPCFRRERATSWTARRWALEAPSAPRAPIQARGAKRKRLYCAAISSRRTPATTCGFFIASRRNGSPSS